jgi:hypothetical protein
MTDTLAPVVPLTAATRIRKPNRRKGSCPSAGWEGLAAICRSYGVTPSHLQRLAPGVGAEAVDALTPLLAAR